MGLVDSGASRSMIRQDVWKELCYRGLSDGRLKNDIRLRSLTGHLLENLGAAMVRMYGRSCKFYVIKNLQHEMLIGTDVMEVCGAGIFYENKTVVLCRREHPWIKAVRCENMVGVVNSDRPVDQLSYALKEAISDRDMNGKYNLVNSQHVGKVSPESQWGNVQPRLSRTQRRNRKKKARRERDELYAIANDSWGEIWGRYTDEQCFKNHGESQKRIVSSSQHFPSGLEQGGLEVVQPNTFRQKQIVMRGAGKNAHKAPDAVSHSSKRAGNDDTFMSRGHDLRARKWPAGIAVNTGVLVQCNRSGNRYVHPGSGRAVEEAMNMHAVEVDTRLPEIEIREAGQGKTKLKKGRGNNRQETQMGLDPYEMALRDSGLSRSALRYIFRKARWVAQQIRSRLAPNQVVRWELGLEEFGGEGHTYHAQYTGGEGDDLQPTLVRSLPQPTLVHLLPYADVGMDQTANDIN